MIVFFGDDSLDESSSGVKRLHDSNMNFERKKKKI